MNVFRKRYRRATLALKRTLSVVPRDDFVERIEAEDLVVRAVAQLPTDQRAALIVTSLLGYSSDEAAQILGVRSSTVRARATRARTALRAAIGEERWIDERAELERAIQRFRPDTGDRRARPRATTPSAAELAHRGGDRGGRHLRGDGRRRGRSSPSDEGARP